MAYTAWPTGVVVSDPIVRPQEAIYGTHYDYMGVGGWISVPTLNEMFFLANHPQIINADGISCGQRKLGMVIKITDLNTYYEFDIASYNTLGVPQKLLAFADNNNFKVKNFGGGGVVNYQDVVGLDTQLIKKIDKTSIVNVPSTDQTQVISAKGLLDAITYSNASTSITVGGINAGTSITSKTIQQVFDMIFAPAFAAGNSSIYVVINNPDPGFSNVIREIGNTDLSATVSWSVNKRTNAISSIAVDGTVVTLNQNMTLAGVPFASQGGIVSRSVGAAGQGTQSYQINVTDIAANQLGSGSNAIAWYHRMYFGTAALTPSAFKAGLLDSSISIYGLSGFVNQAASSRSLNNNYDCTGGKYIYYLYPKASGAGIAANKGFDQVTSNVFNGVNTFSSYTCDSVMLNDRFGAVKEYYIFYTGYQTGKSVNINIV